MIFILLFLALLNPMEAQGHNLKSVVFGYDDFCPYTCLEKDRPGIFPEALSAILNPQGIELELRQASWARLEKLGDSGKVDLLGPLTLKYIKRKNVRATKTLGGFLQGGFMVRADSHWNYTGPDSLADKKIVIIKGYTAPQALADYYNKIRDTPRLIELSGEDGNRRRVQMLAQKRADTMPALYDVFWYVVQLLKLNPADFRSAGDMPLPPDMTAYRLGVFSRDPARNEALIDLLDKGFVRIRKDGTMKAILERYGIHDESTLNPVEGR